MTDSNGTPARLVLLSGFLGAGKTTLLKRLLAEEKDLSGLAVIINEFGPVGIDGALIADQGANYVELTSGCVCCTLANDLRRTLLDIRQRYQPRRILVESSGVADPAGIIQVLGSRELLGLVDLYRIVTVLDADCWGARAILGDLFFRQLLAADLILLNKLDLVPESARPGLAAELEKEFPLARILPTVHCGLEDEQIWDRARSVGEDFESVVTGLSPEFSAFVFRSTRPLDADCLNRVLAELPRGMFRIKGPVGLASGRALLNVVGGKASWSPWTGGPETCLALVGWEIDQERILDLFESCILAGDS